MGTKDQSVIKAVLSGDRDAYGALVRRHSSALFRAAFRITGNQADADDVVQEAFLRGYRKLERFDSRSEFSTWIYRIAVRCAFDRLSVRRREDQKLLCEDDSPGGAAFQLADEAAGPDRLVLSGEIGAMQETAMHYLTATERAAFVLRHMEGCTTEEIALALEIAPGAARNAVFRAVQKLRAHLAPLRVS